MVWHGRDWKDIRIALGVRDCRNDIELPVPVFLLLCHDSCLYGHELFTVN
jgi:DsbC/DsbD-like thiol-disulfide interchange protein